MRLYEIAGVGRITKQNQTPDVGPDAVQKQAAKFGNTVDRDGKPPIIGSKKKTKTTEQKFSNLELAILEGGHDYNDWKSKRQGCI